MGACISGHQHWDSSKDALVGGGPRRPPPARPLAWGMQHNASQPPGADQNSRPRLFTGQNSASVAASAPASCQISIGGSRGGGDGIAAIAAAGSAPHTLYPLSQSSMLQAQLPPGAAGASSTAAAAFQIHAEAVSAAWGAPLHALQPAAARDGGGGGGEFSSQLTFPSVLPGPVGNVPQAGGRGNASHLAAADSAAAWVQQAQQQAAQLQQAAGAGTAQGRRSRIRRPCPRRSLGSMFDLAATLQERDEQQLQQEAAERSSCSSNGALGCGGGELRPHGMQGRLCHLASCPLAAPGSLARTWLAAGQRVWCSYGPGGWNAKPPQSAGSKATRMTDCDHTCLAMGVQLTRPSETRMVPGVGPGRSASPLSYGLLSGG